MRPASSPAVALRLTAAGASLLLLAAGARAQDQTAERLDRLEAENRELRRAVDALSGDVERFQLRDVPPVVGESRFGLGPAASKVYAAESGLSIGGYGEGIFTSYAGDASASTADFLRGVLYTGYKFDEHWVFNSELELEHASTEEAGAASLEFAYLDWLHDDALNVRMGLVLIPMGLVNELHEPTTYLTPNRAETERRILPSTWRENGVGVFGEAGELSYRAYVVNGLDADGFSAGGLRGGRQRGSEALAEDLAFVGRLDWEPEPGFVLGGSVYAGDSSQGRAGYGSAGTTIYELHGEAVWRSFRLRALAAMAELDDVATLNAAKGLTGPDSVGEELEGFYVELGYDVLGRLRPEGRASLTPFVRWESLDTQAAVPFNFSTQPGSDEEIVTLGVAFEPLESIVLKLGFEDRDVGTDSWSLAMGYVF